VGVRLQKLYWHIIERVDGILNGDGWKEHDGFTYIESIASIGNPYIGYIQEVAICHMQFPVVISTTQWNARAF